ncbi:hypothetical protein Slin15195_G130230 [Septoria linicola]|uniref:Uncharacterized protein n=1 Tax=Septoria linicola TaxID=215465 RepID=A0A9Q9B2F1_9PEZI|nr:hypothetical protein Slin15195_G130230 [Septoria linicola]
MSTSASTTKQTASISSSSSTTTSSKITKPRKKASARKLLQRKSILPIPTPPNERLHTLLTRLHRPTPAFVIYEQKRFKAELVPHGNLAKKQPHQIIPWGGSTQVESQAGGGGECGEARGDEDGWCSSVQEARQYAAESACPALEAELKRKVREMENNAALSSDRTCGVDGGRKGSSGQKMENKEAVRTGAPTAKMYTKALVDTVGQKESSGNISSDWEFELDL